LLDLAAVGVPDAIAEVIVRRGGRLDHQHLVAADAEVPVGQLAHLSGAKVDRLAHGIDDDEVVALPVHLGKSQFHAAF